MEDLQNALIIIYLVGVVGVGFAGEKRTIGAFGAIALALFASPLVAAVLILAWPSRMEAEAYYKGKSEEAKAQVNR